MPANHDVTDSLVQRSADFLEMARLVVAKAARAALAGNPNLTAKQRQKLADAERGRYGLQVIALLLESMAEAANPLAFADHVKDASLQSVVQVVAPSLCVVDTYITNTRAQKENDIAQALFLVERTPARRDQLMDTLGPEEATLHFHKLAVQAWNPTGRRTFS